VTASSLHAIVLPGGGYAEHAAHEDEPIARWLSGLGVAASVFHYPLMVRHPAPLNALRAEIRRLRAGGSKRIGLIGFSAGGHLAGLAALSDGARGGVDRRTEGALMTTTDEQTPTDRPTRYADARTKRVTAANAIEYAYRDLGEGDVPLVLLQHFRGSLDTWDPALVDALAADRRVVCFDNVGVAATTGTTPNTVEAMAHGAIAFVEAMSLPRVDLLGFSLGSFVAQEIALIRPDLVRRVVLASSAPQGAAGMHGWASEVIGAIGEPETSPQGYLDVFFAATDPSREAGQQAMGRIFGRTADRDEPTTWQTRQAQYDAVCAWGIPNHSLLQRVAAIDLPVFVANGDSDPMILPRYSYLLAGLLPDARLTIYPDSAHGFLFQHRSRFVADVNSFLAEAD
jgi:pimeloyl-ACP methyl ester carboxylesterase